MSIVSQREQVKRWFKKHPNYYREWTARNKAAKRADRAADAARTKVKPTVVNGRITYAIKVTNPLTEEERAHASQSVPYPTTDIATGKTRSSRDEDPAS